MKRRCFDQTYPQYPDYGGRGITVCDRWRNSFDCFLADMGQKPSPKHSIDRFPDNNGNYEPGNCRWAVQKEQANNTRKTVWVELDGVRRSLVEWCELFAFSRDKAKRACKTTRPEDIVRLISLGLPLPPSGKKIGAPKGYAKRPITFGGKTQSITKWAEEFDCWWGTLGQRIKAMGEEAAMRFSRDFYRVGQSRPIRK